MRKISRWLLLATLPAASLSAAAAHAAWAPEGNPLCNIAGQQYPVATARTTFQIGPAGPQAHGMFVTWQDTRADGGDVYAAMVSVIPPPDPAPGADGFALVVAPEIQWQPVVTEVARAVPTGYQADGPVFVVAWAHDGVTRGIRAKRVWDGPGADWGPTGVAVSEAVAFVPAYPAITDDGGRGAIVTWLEINDAQRLARAQRLDSLGQRQWGANGVPVGTDTTVQGEPAIARAPAGGAYVLRTDHRVGGSIVGPRALVLYRLDGDGSSAPGWPADGVVLGAPQASTCRLIVDGSGGVFAAWIEPEPLSDASSGLEVRLTRIGSDGAPAPGWSLAGTPVVTRDDGHRFLADVDRDGSGGVVVAIEFQQVVGGPGASGRDVLAQRFTGGGSRPAGWPPEGLLLCGAAGTQSETRLLGQDGGLLAAWRDERSGGSDLFGMKLHADGSVAEGWPAAGLLLCGAPGVQSDVRLSPNGEGGAIFAWQDQRDPLTGPDLYIQTVNALGQLDAPRPVLSTAHLSAPRPCPAQIGVELTWSDVAASLARVEVLDAQGRRVRTWREHVAAGTTRLTWDLCDAAGRAVSAGVYQLRVSTARAAHSRQVVVAR